MTQENWPSCMCCYSPTWWLRSVFFKPRQHSPRLSDSGGVWDVEAARHGKADSGAQLSQEAGSGIPGQVRSTCVCQWSFGTSLCVSHVWSPAACTRGSMHCDRIAAEGRSSSEDRLGERSEREARYWTRKLYEFEASDPDRCVTGGLSCVGLSCKRVSAVTVSDR